MLTRLSCICFVLYRRSYQAKYGKNSWSLDKVATWLRQYRIQSESEESVKKDLKKMEDHGSRLVMFEERFGGGFCLVLKQHIARDLFVLCNADRSSLADYSQFRKAGAKEA